MKVFSFHDKRIFMAALVFFAAVAIRSLFLADIGNEAIFRHPFNDSGDQHMSGMSVAGWAAFPVQESDYHRVPLYPYMLGAVYRGIGPDIFFAALVNAILGGVSCVLVFLLGNRYFGFVAGSLAGLLAAFSWPLIVYTAKTLPVNFGILFFAAFLLLFMYAMEWGRYRFFGASGVLIGVCSLLRPNVLLLVPAGIIMVVLFGRGRRKKSILFFLAGTLLALALSVSLDFMERKELIPVQKNWAATMFMGSSFDALELRPGAVWKNKMREMIKEGLINRSDRDRFWVSRSVRKVREDPWKYILHLAEKSYMFFNDREFAPYESIRSFRERAPVTNMPYLPGFGVSAALALAGAVLAEKSKRRNVLIFLVFILSYMVSLILFPPLSRYRLPVFPAFLVLAGYSLDRIRGICRYGRPSEIRQVFLVAGIALFFTLSDPLGYRLEGLERPYYHEAKARLADSDLFGAEASIRKAYKERPNDPDIWECMGDIFFSKGDLEGAEIAYVVALEKLPDFPEVREKLGIIYVKQGKEQEAERILLQAASDTFPPRAGTYVLLGALYTKQDRFEKADMALKKALAIEPDDLRALYRKRELNEKQGLPVDPVLEKRIRRVTGR